MNRVRGMTIKQFNEILNELRSVYNFKDELTRLDDFSEPETRYNRKVSIYTVDEKTGVEVHLSKGAEIDETF